MYEQLPMAGQEQLPMNNRPIPEPRAVRIHQCAADLFASGLLDCDNALLDNDLVEDDLRDCLAVEFRSESRDRYWAIFEQLGAELGYAVGALQRYRLGNVSDARPPGPRLHHRGTHEGDTTAA